MPYPTIKTAWLSALAEHVESEKMPDWYDWKLLVASMSTLTGPTLATVSAKATSLAVPDAE